MSIDLKAILAASIAKNNADRAGLAAAVTAVTGTGADDAGPVAAACAAAAQMFRQRKADDVAAILALAQTMSDLADEYEAMIGAPPATVLPFTAAANPASGPSEPSTASEPVESADETADPGKPARGRRKGPAKS